METRNIIEQLKESFYLATGKNLSEWEKMEIPFVAISDAIYFYYLHNQDKKKALKDFTEVAPKYYEIDPVLPNHKKVVSEFLSLFKEKKLYENELFISSSISLYLPYYKNKILNPDKKRPRLPECQNKEEVFLDLITGFSFIEFYPDLKEDTFYYLTDTSHFVCEGLRQEKECFPNLNIQIIKKDILKLNKEDFHAPVSVLRAKNLFAYVDIMKSDIQHLQSLIRPGGRFVFQEYSYRKIKSSTKIANWFKGWKKTVQRGNSEDKNDLDTITYIKPR